VAIWKVPKLHLVMACLATNRATVTSRAPRGHIAERYITQQGAACLSEHVVPTLNTHRTGWVEVGGHFPNRGSVFMTIRNNNHKMHSLHTAK